MSGTDAASGAWLRIALVQMCAGRDVEANVAAVEHQIRDAGRQGARYVLTPEVTTLMETDRERMLAAAQVEAESVALARFRSLARDLGLYLHIGSMAVRLSADRLANRSFLIRPDGEIAARYDKIHMFDITLGNGEVYEESRSYAPGGEAVVVQMPWGRLGLTICYDLRFPQLFRALAQAGAGIIAVPAAFTRTTGEAHWHALLRARAIEAQCFILAAAQGGHHETGRQTFGHSLVVSPWGEILAEAGVEPSVTVCDLDLARIQQVRDLVPSLRHDRPFEITVVAGGNADDRSGVAR
ncbi:MAG: carbon-nitrogen hydrolase family protein [Hyphomicrobiaceae bacterium]|nr:carbon-nitrogen hydrolase family protein [Hyphomicrobiaceae bacterium]